MAFEMLLPAATSATYYEQFWRGKEAGDDPEIIAVLEAVLRLYCGGDDTSNCLETSYFNSDVNDITWDQGVLKLVEKRAMMAAMGDWAKGFLESEGQVAGKDFDIVPFPGSTGTFVFTSDTFALPKGAPNRAGALALLETFASSEGQVAFNHIKGSIPARLDADASAFDEVTRATIRDFAEATKVLALSGLLASDSMPKLALELKASMQHGSIEIIQNYVRANYDSIRQ
jgi:glucose/mannose transport system substrate-binding protein